MRNCGIAGATRTGWRPVRCDDDLGTATPAGEAAVSCTPARVVGRSVELRALRPIAGEGPLSRDSFDRNPSAMALGAKYWGRPGNWRPLDVNRLVVQVNCLWCVPVNLAVRSTPGRRLVLVPPRSDDPDGWHQPGRGCDACTFDAVSGRPQGTSSARRTSPAGIRQTRRGSCRTSPVVARVLAVGAVPSCATRVVLVNISLNRNF